ncbi:MAG: UbiA family prenyltransferase [Planctomycetaceae bacterium]|nr:UbiA family prenyltransferase [Planctomycetaceae bacterium]
MSFIHNLLRLCRFPTVFTALADIMLGYALSHAGYDSWPTLGWLLVACAGLYLSGMVFNDVFDLKQDQQERPSRPLPSGAISRPVASVFGGLLMIIGIACAAVASLNSLAIALILAATILAYDGPLKRTPLGPLFMGACRMLNVLLGASAVGIRFASVWQHPQLWVACSMGLYIVGVTLFARREASTSSKAGLLLGLGIANLGLFGLAAWIMNWTVHIGLLVGFGAVAQPWTVLLALAVIAFTINRRALLAVADPQPKLVQQTVGTMLLSIIVVDATLIYFKLGDAGIPYAIGTIALLIPAVGLRRWIPLS